MPTIAEVRQNYPQYEDMSDADLGAALHAKFYSDMPKEEFDKKVGLTTPPGDKAANSRIESGFQAAADQSASSMYKKAPGGYGLTDYVRSSLPFGDEAGALGGAIGKSLRGKDFGKSYNEQKALEGLYRDQYARDNPAKAFMGGAASVAAAAPAGVASALPTILQGAKSGAGVGALFGAGEGEGLSQRATNAAVGAGLGGAIGGAVPAVANRVLGARSGKAPIVPTIDDLTSRSQSLYARSESAGVTFSPQGTSRLAASIDSAARKAQINKDLHPDATAALKVVQDMNGKTPTLAQVDQLRQVIKDAAASPKAGDRRVAMAMSERLDDVIGTLGKGDVIGPDPKTAVADLVDARRLWSRKAKAEIIEEAVLKAERRAASTGSGGNVENATRQNIRAILDNPKKARLFTKEERAAMDKVVRGSKSQDLARLVGKLSPSGNGLMAALGIGATVANPVLAAAPVAGIVGKAVSEGMAARNVKMLEELVRRGASSPNPHRKLSATERFVISQGAAYSARK